MYGKAGYTKTTVTGTRFAGNRYVMPNVNYGRLSK